MRAVLAATALIAALLAAPVASAQTVYPIDRADILVGSRFDFKVEFPTLVDPAKVAVTLNGKDLAQIFGKTATFIEREDGKDQSALILRDVSLTKPGSYEVRVTDGAQTRELHWNVYATGPRKAKNVILFIGDGMSLAHRVAARVLAKGIAEARRSASSPSTTCRTWRWSRPRAAIRSLPIRRIPPARMRPAISPRSTPWESMPTAPSIRSMTRKSRPSPASPNASARWR